MYSFTNNLSLLTFDVIIYTKSEQVIILHSIVFYCATRFRKSMNRFLLVDLYNTLKDAKNIRFNLTTVLSQNENINEYT